MQCTDDFASNPGDVRAWVGGSRSAAKGGGGGNKKGGATPVATGRLYARMDATDINVAAKFTKLIVTRVSQYQFMVTHESIVSADWSSTGSDYGYMVTGTLYNSNY